MYIHILLCICLMPIFTLCLLDFEDMVARTNIVSRQGEAVTVDQLQPLDLQRRRVQGAGASERDGARRVTTLGKSCWVFIVVGHGNAG